MLQEVFIYKNSGIGWSDDVLRVFGDALNSQCWPENDGSRTYKPSKANPYYNSIENTRSLKRKAEHEEEDQPSGSSRPRREDWGN